MGGSGGGDSDYTPGGDDAERCEDVDFQTTLLSASAEALLTLAAGMMLEVRAGDFSVIVQKASGEKVGSLVTNATRLLACIADGHEFIATVLEVEHGACRVRVTHVKK